MARLKEMNLYQRYRETDVHRTKPGTVVWKAMPFVLLIALLVGVWLYLSAQNRALEKELRQTDEAIASQTLLRDVSRARAGNLSAGADGRNGTDGKAADGDPLLPCCHLGCASDTAGVQQADRSSGYPQF